MSKSSKNQIETKSGEWFDPVATEKGAFIKDYWIEARRLRAITQTPTPDPVWIFRDPIVPSDGPSKQQKRLAPDQSRVDLTSPERSFIDTRSKKWQKKVAQRSWKRTR